MPVRPGIRSIAFLVQAVAVAGPVRGGVIFSDLSSDPSHRFDSAFIWGIAAPAKLAMPFTAAGSSTWAVSQIDLALKEDLGGSFAATMSLNSDANGLPGAVIQSWTLT